LIHRPRGPQRLIHRPRRRGPQRLIQTPALDSGAIANQAPPKATAAIAAADHFPTLRRNSRLFTESCSLLESANSEDGSLSIINRSGATLPLLSVAQGRKMHSVSALSSARRGSNSGFSSLDSDVCDFAAGGAVTAAARLANPVRTASLLFITVGFSKRHPSRLARTNSQVEGIVFRPVFKPLCFWGGVACGSTDTLRKRPSRLSIISIILS